MSHLCHECIPLFKSKSTVLLQHSCHISLLLHIYAHFEITLLMSEKARTSAPHVGNLGETACKT